MYDENAFTAELKLIWSTVTSFKPGWYKMGSQDVEIKDAWQMYKNARDCNLPELLLGDLKLRSQIEVLKNFGTTSGTESTMERKTLVDDKGATVYPSIVNADVMTRVGKAYKSGDGIAHIRRGSVLNDGWWWPFKNDAWVIGGIHGLKRFHLTMAKAPDDLLWDTKDKRPRVLGRELLGLGAFGYKLIGVPSWAKLDPSTPRPTAEQLKNKTPTAALKTIPVAPKDVREAIGNVFAPQLKVSATGATFTAYYAALSKITKIEDIKGASSAAKSTSTRTTSARSSNRTGRSCRRGISPTCPGSSALKQRRHGRQVSKNELLGRPQMRSSTPMANRISTVRRKGVD